MGEMEKHLRTAGVLAHLLDNSFSLFGKRFGLNGVLGLLPGAGDVITGALSLYMVWIGLEMRLPLHKILEMIGNVAFNFFVGLIPVLGDAVDFFNKANTRNLRILRDYAKKHVIDGEIVDASHTAAVR